MRAALIISDRDNVATALQRLEPGSVVDVGPVTVTVAEMVPPGHKIALRQIAAGAPIIKYGNPIGTASIDIPPGTHVHIHNVASARGRGDLGAPSGAAEARLAEPPDEASRRTE